MEPELTKLGSFISVPSVKEVVAKNVLGREIPLQYQRPDLDPPFDSVASACTSLQAQVPVIDMLRLQLSQDFMDVELQKLHHACRDWGFFQLINHGVSNLLLDKVKKGIEGLFNLPIEEKKKLSWHPGDLEGFGKPFVFSEEQKLDWADVFYITTLPTHLRKSYLFPNLPLPFRDDVEAYSEELRNIAMKILGFLGKALGIDPDDMRIFEGGWQAMRMNYYPPCPQPELAIGLSSHSDSAAITILREINDMEGLQIRKDGAWVSIKPLPDAFVVNLGNIMEIMTNGIYRSIEHRVTVNSEKERMSIATFYAPKLDGELGPAPSLISPENPPNFKSMGVEDYYKEFFKRRLEGKSFLDALRIQN